MKKKEFFSLKMTFSRKSSKIENLLNCCFAQLGELKRSEQCERSDYSNYESKLKL